MRVTVDPAIDLLRRLGSPERGLQVVHVAGTKGKGTVSSLVHHALRAAGLRAGCYTSPHVERVNERVRVDGADIEDGELARVLELALDALGAAETEGSPACDASWFDVLTAAAVVAFRDAGVEWAVVECGLGGRLDSTNALDGRVCVITNIDLEHTEILGTTRAAIAREKAGILWPGAVLVTAVPEDDEAGRAIEAVARELGVPVRRPSRRMDPSVAMGHESLEGTNVALAGLVLDELGEQGVRSARAELDGARVGSALLRDGVVRAARLPGRLERLSIGGATLVLDGAHVPSSLARVLADLEREGLSAPARAVVFGARRDKDLDGLLKVLAGRTDRLVCTSVGAELSRRPEEIRRAAEENGLTAETAVSPRVALERCLALCAGGGWALVTGSLHLIGAVKAHLDEHTRC